MDRRQKILDRQKQLEREKKTDKAILLALLLFGLPAIVFVTAPYVSDGLRDMKVSMKQHRQKIDNFWGFR